MVKSYISGTLILGLCYSNIYAEDKNIGLDSITVTAQKQEENLQEIPMSISVLDEYEIEDKNINSVIDLSNSIPNFTVFNNGFSTANTPVTRGMYVPIESGHLSTGLYIDGVPVINAASYDTEFVNIQRAEVLKGPQSTLYGKNASMGVVNIITKEPTEDSGSIKVDIGNNGYRNLSANVNKLLMEDKLIFSLGIKNEQEDGYIKNTYKDDYENDKEKTYGKVALKYLIDDKNSVKISFDRTKYNDGGFPMVLVGETDVSSGLETFNKAQNDSMFVKYEHNIDEDFTFTSLTSKNESKQNEQTDYDFSEYAYTDFYNDSTSKEFVQEFKINKTTDKVNLVAGLYLSKSEEHTSLDFDYTDYGYGTSNIDRIINAKSYALFSQLDYKIAKDLSLILGARYESNQKDFEDTNTDMDLDNTWTDVSPKVALQYNISDNSNIYGSISKGYKSGGYNIYVSNGYSSEYFAFDEERLISYEIGTKNTLLDNRLVFNAAVFYMKVDDMQVSQSLTATSTYVSNAAKATGKGFEIDMKYKLSENIDTSFGFGYNDVTFDEFSDDYGDYAGNQSPYSPKYSYNLGTTYRGDDGIYSSMDLFIYGKTYLDKKNEYSRDAYKLVNVKIGYETSSYDIYLYAKNLFDEEYDSVGYNSGYYTLVSAPRQVGVQLAYRF